MPLPLLYLLAFLKAHWRPVAAVALISAAFLGGRCSVPRPTVKTVTQVQTRVEYRDRVVTQTVEHKAEQKTETKTVVVFRDRVVHKDGTSETKEEIRQVSGLVDVTADSQKTKSTAEHHEVSEGKTSTSVSVDAPRWFAGLNLGVPVSLRAPYVGLPFIVVHADYRFFGPLSVGAWGSFDVKGNNPALGLSIGVGF